MFLSVGSEEIRSVIPRQRVPDMVEVLEEVLIARKTETQSERGFGERMRTDARCAQAQSRAVPPGPDRLCSSPQGMPGRGVAVTGVSHHADAKEEEMTVSGSRAEKRHMRVIRTVYHIMYMPRDEVETFECIDTLYQLLATLS